MDKTQEGVKIEGEDTSGNLAPEALAQEREDKAREKGWKPFEEWEGDPDQWIEAKEFLDREPLYATIAGLKKEIWRQRTSADADFKTLTVEMAKMKTDAYEQALKELKAERRAAKADGDDDAVDEIDERIGQTKQEQEALIAATRNQVAQKTQGLSPHFQEWQDKNKWFTDDQDMRQEAIRQGIAYGLTNKQAPEQEVTAHVEKVIKKMYPEKFQKASRPPNPVEGATTTRSNEDASNNTRKTKLRVSDLTDVERTAMKTFVKRGVLTEAQYLESLADRKAATR